MTSRLALALAFALVACGTDPVPVVSDDTAAPDSTTGDTAEDVAEDTAEDVAEEDVAEDTAEDLAEDTAEDLAEDTAQDVVEDTTEDTAEDLAEDTDPGPCVDGEFNAREVTCGDGVVRPTECVCTDERFVCESVCGVVPLCDSDSDCAAQSACDPCATDSCIECDDCIAGCNPHGCPTEPRSMCDLPRPECGENGVAVVVADGCWVCVDETTCEPIPVTSDCEAAGATCVDADACPRGTGRIRSSCEPTGGICCLPERDTSCDDGEPVVCASPGPVCGDHELMAAIGGCWQCVNPITCLAWGEAECETAEGCARGEVCNGCATSSCPDCDDCVAACEPAG